MTEYSYLPGLFLEYLRNGKAILYALTTGVCVCAGLSLFLIWRRTLREQLWLLYFSLAYLLWAAQYVFRWLETGLWGPIFCSTINNYCLVLSALLLFRWLTLFRGTIVTVLLLLTVALSQVAAGSPFERVPDSVASVGTLGLLGFGLSQAIPLGQSRRRLRTLSQAIALGYIGIQVFYVLSPWLAELVYDNSPLLGTPDNPYIGLGEQGVLAGFDLLAFACALPLKLIFYLVALYTVSRSIERLHPRGSEDAGLRGDRRPPATVAELAEHFRKVLDADVCEICLRLPGQENPQILWREAVRGKAPQPARSSLPAARGSYVGRVLASGRGEWEPRIPADSPRYLERHAQLRRRQSILTVPIGLRTAFTERYNAASGSSASRRPTIGALNVEWFEPIALTETMALQVQQMADQIAPYLEKERELAAIDSLSQRVGFLESGTEPPFTAGAVVGRIAGDVHDLLAPNRTEVHLKWGFEEVTPIVVTGGETAPALSNHEQGSVPARPLERAPSVRLTTRLQVAPEKRAKNTLPSWVHDLGTLDIVVPAPQEAILDIERPILGTTKFHRGLIASMVVDAALDAYRRTFGDQISRIALAINAPSVQTPDQWWQALNAAVAEEGLCWAAARKDRDSPLLCPMDFAGKLESLRLPASWKVIDVFAPPDPLAMEGTRAAHAIAKLELPGVADGWLWVGIPRRGFGPELADPPSPWRVFLENIAATAGGALARIRAREQIDILTREAMVAQSVVVGSTVLHDVMNHATSVVNNLHVFQHGLNTGQVVMQDAHRELLGSILREAADLDEVMSSLRQARGYDEERPTSLNKALTIVERLHHFRLEKQRFRFELAIPSDLPQIDAPLHVLTLVLSNLVGNSLDVRKAAGRIWIHAKPSPGWVICDVRDDGPGLPLDREVFAAGKSTKPGGTGLGLWLSKRCLEDIGGQIVAGPRGGPGARFTLHLPTSAKENES